MHFWDGIACADSDPKESAAAGDKSERPAEQKMSLDETLPQNQRGDQNHQLIQFRLFQLC